MPHPAPRGARAVPALSLGAERKKQLGAALAAVASLAILAPVVHLVTRPVPPRIVAACPPVTTSHIAVIVGTARSTESESWTESALAIFEVATGRRVASHGLDRYDDDARRTLCLGPARPGTVWIRRGGEASTLEIRDARTGAVVVPFEALVRATPALATGIDQVGWDVDTGTPTLSLRDGHVLRVDPVTLATSRYAGNVTMNPLGVRADEVIRSQSVPYYLGGMAGLVLDDGTRLTLDGHPRAYVVRAGTRLFGERDFYMPAMLQNPATGRVAWHDPASLVIVEETLVGSLVYRVTRIGLDGRVLYTFDPGTPLPASLRYRPVPWTPSADGTKLLHFGGDGIIAIDARTGRELYRVGYDGEPLARE